MNKTQNKFRTIQDHIFTLKQIIEEDEKTEGKVKYIWNIDLEKAFDRVPRETIWKILSNRGIKKKIIGIIKKMYENNKEIIYYNAKSEKFKTREGLRQGGEVQNCL